MLYMIVHVYDPRTGQVREMRNSKPAWASWDSYSNRQTDRKTLLSLKRFIIFNYAHLYVSVWVCTGVSAGTLRGQKRALDPLELELQVVRSHPTWVLGTKLWKNSVCAQLLSCLSRPSKHPLIQSEEGMLEWGICRSVSLPLWPLGRKQGVRMRSELGGVCAQRQIRETGEVDHFRDLRDRRRWHT